MLDIAHPYLLGMLVGLLLAAIDLTAIHLRRRGAYSRGRKLWLTAVPVILVGTTVASVQAAVAAIVVGTLASGAVFCYANRSRLLSRLRRGAHYD